jgi:hypothetical protein
LKRYYITSSCLSAKIPCSNVVLSSELCFLSLTPNLEVYTVSLHYARTPYYVAVIADLSNMSSLIHAIKYLLINECVPSMTPSYSHSYPVGLITLFIPFLCFSIAYLHKNVGYSGTIDTLKIDFQFNKITVSHHSSSALEP